MTWVLDLVRMLLSIFDRMVYGLIEVFYTTFSSIANTRIFSDATLREFSGRIYAFLAIIMLFKVTFSIITYIINPDNFNNNEKGIGKLIQNIIITLLLIVIVPFVFEQAYNLQRIILKENILGKVILGTSVSNPGYNIMDDKTVHRTMSYSVLSAFLKFNEDEIEDLSYNDNGDLSCDGNTININDARIDDGKLTFDESNPAIGCLNNLSAETTIIKVWDGGKEVKKPALIGTTYYYAHANQSYQTLISLINAKYKGNKDVYMLDYTYLISTIAGGFIAWVLFIFCFDVAVRSVKLSFLQLIAPIPIVSYIDPKSSKSGMFQKWVKVSIGTYADLFIRLLAIYFSVYIIKTISTSGNLAYIDGGTPGANIRVFIIVGALMFAKQLPKLIEDITGIKLSGKFTLNPLKKFEDEALGGKRITSGVAGLVTGGIAGAATGGLGGFLRGGLNGLGRGFWHGQGMRATRDDLVRRRHAMELSRENGSTLGQRNLTRLQTFFGQDTQEDRVKREQRQLDRQLNEIADQQSADKLRANQLNKAADAGKKIEDRSASRIKEGKAGQKSVEYNRMLEDLNTMKAARDAAVNSGSLWGSALDAENQRIAEVESSLADALERMSMEYTDDVMNGVERDPVLSGFIEDYRTLSNIAGYGDGGDTAQDIHRVSGQMKGNASDITRTFMNAEATVEEIKEHQRQLKERERIAKANSDAVRATSSHGNGGHH